MFIVLQGATDKKFNIKRKANKLTAESSRYFRERDPHCNFVSHAWHDFENLKIMSVLHVNHAGKRQDAIKSCKFARCEVRFIKLDSFEVIRLLVWVHKVNCGKHVFKFCEILLQFYWFFLLLEARWLQSWLVRAPSDREIAFEPWPATFGCVLGQDT